MTLSTHVLDVTAGIAAAELRVTLFSCIGEERREIAASSTNQDGRIPAPFGGELSAGEYELVFSVREYFARTGTRAFYDRIAVRFRIDGQPAAAGGRHYHVPLLLSPWSYSTYRGS